MTTDPTAADRQPAYDAVFAYIRQQPRDFLPTNVVDRNAMIWRAVNAALDAVVSPPPDRAAWLAAADALETYINRYRSPSLANWTGAVAFLRDRAVEAHGTGTQRQPDTEVPTLPDRLQAALTERFTELGNPYSRMVVHEKGPDGWPATHPVGPAKVAEVLRELLADEPAPVAQQPAAHTGGTAEEPARIDKLRPEFTEHASVESIDAQLQRARSQQRRWHLRVEWLISLRQARMEQKQRGEWPATEQQAAAADGEETRRCAHTDIVYGRCVLPIPHDGECVHERQPRCAMPSPDGQHSCVLPPNHEWLHADKHLAEVMPNGSRVVWETPVDAPPSA